MKKYVAGFLCILIATSICFSGGALALSEEEIFSPDWTNITREAFGIDTLMKSELSRALIAVCLLVDATSHDVLTEEELHEIFIDTDNVYLVLLDVDYDNCIALFCKSGFIYYVGEEAIYVKHDEETEEIWNDFGGGIAMLGIYELGDVYVIGYDNAYEALNLIASIIE